MPLIKSVGEVLREHMTQGAAAAKQKYLRCIRPIYGLKVGRRVHVGTGFVVQLGNSRYLITAAHVIDQVEHSGCLVAGRRHLVPIKEGFYSTEAPHNKRSDDHFDFAWMRLHGALDDELGSTAITEADISRNRVEPSTAGYVAMGFPRSKNKKSDPAVGRITPRARVYYSLRHDVPELYKALGITGNDHIVIGHGDRSRNETGDVVNSIHPRGMSGGPLFHLGEFADPAILSKTSVFPGTLCGLVIELYEEHSALLSVKIDTIIACIQANT